MCFAYNSTATGVKQTGTQLKAGPLSTSAGFDNGGKLVPAHFQVNTDEGIHLLPFGEEGLGYPIKFYYRTLIIFQHPYSR